MKSEFLHMHARDREECFYAVVVVVAAGAGATAIYPCGVVRT